MERFPGGLRRFRPQLRWDVAERDRYSVCVRERKRDREREREREESPGVKSFSLQICSEIPEIVLLKQSRCDQMTPHSKLLVIRRSAYSVFLRIGNLWIGTCVCASKGSSVPLRKILANSTTHCPYPLETAGTPILNVGFNIATFQNTNCTRMR